MTFQMTQARIAAQQTVRRKRQARLWKPLLTLLAIGGLMASVQLATGWSAADQVCDTMEMMR